MAITKRTSTDDSRARSYRIRTRSERVRCPKGKITPQQPKSPEAGRCEKIRGIWTPESLGSRHLASEYLSRMLSFTPTLRSSGYLGSSQLWGRCLAQGYDLASRIRLGSRGQRGAHDIRPERGRKRAGRWAGELFIRPDRVASDLLRGFGTCRGSEEAANGADLRWRPYRRLLSRDR